MRNIGSCVFVVFVAAAGTFVAVDQALVAFGKQAPQAAAGAAVAVGAMGIVICFVGNAIVDAIRESSRRGP